MAREPLVTHRTQQVKLGSFGSQIFCFLMLCFQGDGIDKDFLLFILSMSSQQSAPLQQILQAYKPIIKVVYSLCLQSLQLCLYTVVLCDPTLHIRSFTQSRYIFPHRTINKVSNLPRMASYDIYNMLNFADFTPCDGYKPIKFSKLAPFSDTKDIYSCVVTMKRYRVTIFSEKLQFQNLAKLHKDGIFSNIQGFLKKKHLYYCFSEVGGYQTLAGYIEEINGQKELITELFCLELIESMLTAAKECDKLGRKLMILSPHHIIINESHKKGRRFTLTYPQPHSLFEGLNEEIITSQMEFCSPEILIAQNESNQYSLVRKVFPKAAVYSLGLILLYCFGYRIKVEERKRANQRQFTVFLKALRKQIKLLQQGKFISKIIKIALQQNEYVRDNLYTFEMKLQSAHLQSLRRLRYNPIPANQQYIPTVYSDHSEKLQKSSLNRTIEIRGSNLSVTLTHNKSEGSQRDGIDSSMEQRRSLFDTFKKSPENFKMHSEIIEEEHENHAEEEVKLEVASPIEIHLDWDDSDSQSERSPSKNKSQEDVSNPCISKDLSFNEDDLRIAVHCDPKENKQTHSDTKPARTILSALGKSAKSNDGGKRLRDIMVEGEIESKGELRADEIKPAEMSLSQLHTKNDKYHVMVEEQPEIIKYSQEQYKLGVSPKLVKKRTSKGGSVDLQDMTLIEQARDESTVDTGGRNSTNYHQIKQQFNQKSQAIFITLLISFLIYKVIDYFIQ